MNLKIPIGTRSLLFGAHQVFLHPLFVALAWRRLYGSWPRRLPIWVAFVIHDWGYWGLPNLDGREGSAHPLRGANLLGRLFDRRVHVVWAGEWWRFAERADNRIAWVLHLTVYGLPANADLSNRCKAAEDLICAMTGLRDCNTKRITMEREPPHGTLGKCVKLWVVTTSLVDE
jgi:hypothetical protein